MWDEETGDILDSSNSYLIQKDKDRYYVYYDNEMIGEIPAEDVDSGYCDLPIKRKK